MTDIPNTDYPHIPLCALEGCLRDKTLDERKALRAALAAKETELARLRAENSRIKAAAHEAAANAVSEMLDAIRCTIPGDASDFADECIRQYRECNTGECGWLDRLTAEQHQPDACDEDDGGPWAPCWHCGDVIAVDRPRCENCPDECDVEDCEAPGCAKTEGE